jgi:YesN/AraC family two-component response regulator
MLWVDMCHRLSEDWASGSFVADFELQQVSPTDLVGPGPSIPALRPDIICFDYDYPDMTSLQQLSAAKKHHPSIPILMLTLQRSADLAVWAIRARVFDYLIKPLDAAEIEQFALRLKSVLEAKRSQSSRQAISSTPRAPREARYYARAAARTRVQKAIPHVAKHFATRISEPQVAELCGLSPFRFSREFRATFGRSFQEYLCNLRVAEARRLLENYAMPVADIGAAVGFDDPSYFARVFRRTVGMSPSDFRSSLGAQDSAPPPAILPSLLPRRINQRHTKSRN